MDNSHNGWHNGLVDGQHNGNAMEINGVMETRQQLTEQEMENWHNGRLGNGQLAQWMA